MGKQPNLEFIVLSLSSVSFFSMKLIIEILTSKSITLIT